MVDNRQLVGAAQLVQSQGDGALGNSGEVFSLAVSARFTRFRH